MAKPINQLDLTKVKKYRTDGSLHFRPDELHEAALAYLDTGFSFIPIAADGSKQPAFHHLPVIEDASGHPRRSWKLFSNKRRPTSREVARWYATQPATEVPGLAIVAGAISGQLEIIDFDHADIFLEWQELLLAKKPELLRQIVWVRSPRPGVHGYYRCRQAEGNQKLACRPTIDPETGKPVLKTLIEMKGEGGYVLAPPSPAACHPTGQRYRYLTGRDLTEIQVISDADRALILELARSFDKSPAPKPVRPKPTTPNLANGYGLRPSDIFNQTATWDEILVPHGWQLVSELPNGECRWCRPGKEHSVSATTGYQGRDVLYVFSASADPLEPERAYSKFAAYALLEHDGDFTRAARAVKQSSNPPPHFSIPTLKDIYGLK